jgi:hypothetical protein
MAKRVQRRRGTTNEHSTFTGADGEVTVDTTKDTAVVHDGSQVGGHPLAREDLSNVTNKVGIQQLNLSDGSAGQVIKTDGSGTISFTTVVTDPNMGGDLSGTTSNAQIAANKVGITELNVSDGSAGQVLKTDGSGTLSFSSISSDPTMGGDLSGTASNAQIAANAVTATEIATGAVTSTKILDGTIATGDIADLAISTAKLAANAITTAKITDANVTTAKIADDAITEAKINAQTITNASIYPGTIRSQEIENLTITGTDIADNSISGSKIALGGDAQGDIMHFDGGNWARLGPATSGWLLKTNGPNANPSWIAPTSAGLPSAGVDGNVLTSDGTNWNSETPLGGVGGELVSMQVFTSDGSSSGGVTWTRPAGVKRILVQLVGPGGSALGGTLQGAGAGGGGCAISVFDVTNLASATVTIGNSTQSATFAGTGITTMTANAGASTAANSQAGGAGGTATGGQINITGGKGTDSPAATGNYVGGGIPGGPIGGIHGRGQEGAMTTNNVVGAGGSLESTGVCHVYEYSDASANLVGEKLVSSQLFTSGSGTWTRPTGVTKIEVWATGSGGNSPSTLSSGNIDGGGGGGGTSYAIVDVTNIATAPYVVGTVTAGNATNGASSFNTTIIGNAGGNGTTSSAGGGTGGTGSGGTSFPGANGDRCTGSSLGNAGGESYLGGSFGKGANGESGGPTQGTTGAVFIKEYSDPSLVGGLFGTGVITQRLIVNENDTTGRTGTWIKPTGVNTIEVELVGTGQNGGQDRTDGQGTPIVGLTGGSSAMVHNTIDVRDITSIQYVVGHRTTGSPNNYTNNCWGAASYFGTNGSLQTTSLTVTVSGGAVTAITNPGSAGSGLTGSHVPIIIEATSTAATGNIGTGATAIATVSSGAVTGITVTNGGSGYVTGQVTAFFGMAVISPSTSWGGVANKNCANSASLYAGGYGNGGAGQNAGGGPVGLGGPGAIYIKEFRSGNYII